MAAKSAGVSVMLACNEKVAGSQRGTIDKGRTSIIVSREDGAKGLPVNVTPVP